MQAIRAPALEIPTSAGSKTPAQALREVPIQGTRQHPMPHKLDGKQEKLAAAIREEIALLKKAKEMPWRRTTQIKSEGDGIAGRIAGKVGVSPNLVMQMIYGNAIPKAFAGDRKLMELLASVKTTFDEAKAARREWQKEMLGQAVGAEIAGINSVIAEPRRKLRNLQGKGGVCTRIAKKATVDADWVAAFVYGMKFPRWVKDDAALYALVQSVVPLHLKAEKAQQAWRRQEIGKALDALDEELALAKKSLDTPLPPFYRGKGNISSRIAKASLMGNETVGAWLAKNAAPNWLSEDEGLGKRFMSLKGIYAETGLERYNALKWGLKKDLVSIIGKLKRAVKNPSAPLMHYGCGDDSIAERIASEWKVSAATVRGALFGSITLDCMREDSELDGLFKRIRPIYMKAVRAKQLALFEHMAMEIALDRGKGKALLPLSTGKNSYARRAEIAVNYVPSNRMPAAATMLSRIGTERMPRSVRGDKKLCELVLDVKSAYYSKKTGAAPATAQ